MRSPTRRAASWLVGSVVVLVTGAVAWTALAPDGEPSAEPSTTAATSAARPPGSSGSSVSAVSAPSTDVPDSALTTVPGPTTSLARSPVPEVVVGAIGELTSLNAGSTEGRTPVGILAAAQVLPSAFVVDGHGVPVQNPDLLADVQVIPGQPQTVVYRIAETARWSDGTPITCDDFQLAWIAGRGSTGSDGTPLFHNAAPGYEAVSQVSCAGKTASVLFARSNPGWQLLFGSLLPAHVVLASKGLHQVDLARAAQGEPLTLIALSQAWNAAYRLDGALPTVSGGPFVPSELVPGDHLVLTSNPSWWGPRPTLDRIVLRLFPSADAAVQAFAAGDVQVIGTPLPPAAAKAAAAVPGAVVKASGGAVYDHLVFNFGNPLFQDRQVREALASCVPRDRIAAKLAAAGEGTGVRLDDHLVVPFQQRYQPDLTGLPVLDVKEARATLERDGWRRGADGIYVRDGKRFTVRLLRDDSARSAIVSAELRPSCRDAGIDVVDQPVSVAARDAATRSGDFDLVLTQNRTRLSPTGAQAVYGTRAAENLGDYSSAAVDELFIALSGQLGPPAQDETMGRIDALLWADLPTIPLTQPAVWTAVSGRLDGVQPNPTAAGLLWNAATWTVRPA
jgi:peptide/nickel transport system substrate-binding protein